MSACVIYDSVFHSGFSFLKLCGENLRFPIPRGNFPVPFTTTRRQRWLFGRNLVRVTSGKKLIVAEFRIKKHKKFHLVVKTPRPPFVLFSI